MKYVLRALLFLFAAVIIFLLYVIRIHGEAEYIRGFYEAQHLQQYDVHGNPVR